MAASLSIATDKQTYQPGETVTLTATYTDDQGESFTVNVSAQAADEATPPNTATAQTSFDVQTVAPAPMTVTVSDDHSDQYTQVSSAPGQAVFTTAAPAS